MITQENTDLNYIKNLLANKTKKEKEKEKIIRIALVLAHNHDICNEEYYNEKENNKYGNKFMEALLTYVNNTDVATIAYKQYEKIYGFTYNLVVPLYYNVKRSAFQALPEGITAGGGKGKKITKPKKNK